MKPDPLSPQDYFELIVDQVARLVACGADYDERDGQALEESLRKGLNVDPDDSVVPEPFTPEDYYNSILDDVARLGACGPDYDERDWEALKATLRRGLKVNPNEPFFP